MIGALILAPVLLLADIWHSPQLGVVHRHPLYAVVGGIVALAAVAAVALLIARCPPLFAALAVVALPFRIPIEAAGITSNLLVPLYFVVAAGALAFAVPALLGGGEGSERAAGRVPDAVRWIELLLAVALVLYAIQAIYSPDFEKALQQMVFFYVPFALLFCLLRTLTWSPQLLRTCLLLVVGLALVFACVGFVEYATKTLLLNPKLVAQNNLHTYFTVNSVFFDPDIFGRFLALVMTLVAAVLLYSPHRRDQLAATGTLVVLWAGLVLTLSRSSLGALLVGLGTLAALRWNASRTLLVALAVVALGAAVLAATPTTFGLNQGLNGASSGRAGLISGGARMFDHRLLWGYGSGAFVHEYQKQNPTTSQNLAASHTIAITIAAEQGLIGELPYLALVLVSAIGLIRGAARAPARAAIAAAFLALVFHTELYADFLEDPFTWTLLAIGTALAIQARAAPASGAEREHGVPSALAA
jgi:O-antigen ligase